MSKAQYDIYVENVFKLSKKLVIKNILVALTINRELKQLGQEVFDLYPETWKYYLNLGGQYHSTDRMMTVVSLDTLQTIEFTKENLLLHVSTAREYALEERSFQELLSRFPEQELLIRGILYPVDIDVALAAEDGEVLYYEPELVEENETNFIPKLSEWTRNYMQRWNNKAYFEVDDLYAAAQFASLFLLIPSVILNIRLANCHTRFVHSFHIREYLASHGRLDVFVEHMTKKQMLWLYRNIRYIHHHAGKQETFDWLIENILTDRGLPLAEWSMRHNLQDQIANIYAKVEFERKPLNFGFSANGADRRSVETMLDAEQPLARGNARIQREAELIITETMENALSDKLRTKALESSVLDTTDSAPYTLSDALLNHWILWAHSNRYTAVVTADNPKTGATIQLNAEEAFLVFLYCYNVQSGSLLINLPSVVAHLVRRMPAADFAELRGLVEPELVADEWIRGLVQAQNPIRDLYVSTAAFNDDVTLIHRGQLRQRAIYCFQEHFEARGQMEMAMLRCYEDVVCDFGEATTFTSWFAVRGLDIASLTYLEAGILSEQLLEKATGADLKKIDSLKEMQAAMLRLMTQLSSYSVQYLQDINDDRIQTVEWPAVRVGDTRVEGFDHQNVEAVDAGLQDFGVLGRDRDVLDLSEIGAGVEFDATASHREPMDVDIITEQTSKLGIQSHVHIAWIDVLNYYIDGLLVTQGTDDRSTIEYQANELVPLSNAFNWLISPHYGLTAAERTEILARWNAYQPGEMLIHIETVMTDRWLDGFYPNINGIIINRWLDGFYPLPSTTITLDGLDYPLVPLENLYLNLYGRPEYSLNAPSTMDLGGFNYPTLELPGTFALPGFNYPDANLPPTFALPGFNMPPVILPGFDYPP